MSFEHFLRTYVYLQDRAQTATVKFVPWLHLIQLAKDLITRRLVIVLKARQIGITWLLCAYAVWKCRFHENARVVALSQTEDDAFKIIGKCKFIDDHLPDWMQAGGRSPDQRGFITFVSTGSEVEGIPSVSRAGRGADATVVISDEWEFHDPEHVSGHFAALKPAIDAGGQYIGVSTSDTTKLNTFFKEKYLAAKSGMSDFYPVFLGYDVRPGRDEKWREQVIRDLRAHEAQGEYPRTEEDALSVVKTRKFFDMDALDRMALDDKSPIEHELSNKYQGLVTIYELPVIGERYCIFSDPSDGKEDPHAIIVMKVKTGVEVACSHGKTPADLCAQIHDDFVRLYNDAFNSYELNARAGGLFSGKLKELDTPKQCGFIKTDLKLDNKKTGWWTGKKLRDTFFWGLEEAVRLGQVTIRSKEARDEFKNFIVPEGEEPQKPRGGHDDYIDAWARVWYLRRYVPMGGIKITSFKYKES